MSSFKLNKRQIMRKKAAFRMDRGLCRRRELSDDEATQYFAAIFKDKQAVFGIIKLCEQNLDAGYPAPKGVAMWMTRCNFLQFALFCRRDDIAAALLRGGANPISLYFGHCSDHDVNNSSPISAELIALSHIVKATIKSTGVRTQFLLWILRGVLMLQHAQVTALVDGTVFLDSSRCAYCGCISSSCDNNSGVVLLRWPCCGHTVCYQCYWRRHILKLDTATEDSMIGPVDCFLIPDICCPNKTCGCLYSDLSMVRDSPHYKKMFASFPLDRTCPAVVNYTVMENESSHANASECMSVEMDRPRYIMYIADLAREEIAEAGAGADASSPERLRALRQQRNNRARASFVAFCAIVRERGGGKRATLVALPRFIFCTQRLGVTPLQRITAWQYAVIHGDFCRMYSLAQAGMDVDWADEYGHTAMFWSVMYGQYNSIPVLLHFGANYKLLDYVKADILDVLWGLFLGSGVETGCTADAKFGVKLMGAKSKGVGLFKSRADVIKCIRSVLVVMREHLPCETDYTDFIEWHNERSLRPTDFLHTNSSSHCNAETSQDHSEAIADNEVVRDGESNVDESDEFAIGLVPCLLRMSLADDDSRAECIAVPMGSLNEQLKYASLDDRITNSSVREVPMVLWLRSYRIQEQIHYNSVNISASVDETRTTAIAVGCNSFHRILVRRVGDDENVAGVDFEGGEDGEDGEDGENCGEDEEAEDGFATTGTGAGAAGGVGGNGEFDFAVPVCHGKVKKGDSCNQTGRGADMLPTEFPDDQVVAYFHTSTREPGTGTATGIEIESGALPSIIDGDRIAGYGVNTTSRRLTTAIHKRSSNASLGSHLMLVEQIGEDNSGTATDIDIIGASNCGEDANDSSVLVMTVSSSLATHPGSKGSFVLDRGFSELFINSLLQALRGGDIPITPACKVSCSDRSYIYDSSGLIRASLRHTLRNICCRCGGYKREGNESAVVMDCDECGCSEAMKKQYARCRFNAHAKMRFLQYNVTGGDLAPHVDISKTAFCPITGRNYTSTHTFIIYLTSSEDYTGETAILESLVGAPAGGNNTDGYGTSVRSASDTIGHRRVLASVSPVRNRLFVFPHDTPHAGLPVLSPPKTLLRGELYISNF